MKYGDKGPVVKKLQLALLKAGYKLPTFGADGHFGDETWEALQDFAMDNEYIWNPEVPDTLVEAMMKDISSRESPVSDEFHSIKAYDMRGDPPSAKGKNKMRTRGGQPLERAPSAVTGIVIHQTAVEYGASTRMIKAAGGDEQLAIARRAKDIAAHAVSFDGYYVQSYPLSYYIYHGNGLNRKTLGLEIDGLYPGLMDDPNTIEREDLNTIWGSNTATAFSIRREKAAKAALRYLVEEGRRLGMPIKYIYAHRQSSSTRRSDPGEEIWRKVVLDYAVPVLGLETQPQYTTGTGKSIPRDWDPEGVGTY